MLQVLAELAALMNALLGIAINILLIRAHVGKKQK